jgi:uncharacterized membrane protein HdeD (DUF308 family)
MNAKKADREVEEIAEQMKHELQGMRNDWWIFLLLGVLLMVCGAFAIVFPFVYAVSFTIVMGAALIVGGVATIIGAFWAGRWSGFFLQMLTGIFYTVIGFAIIDCPTTSISVLTLLIAAFFVVIGIFRIVASLSLRFPQWGWALFGGILTTMMGVIIYKTYPVSAIWVIAILVAAELISSGLYWAVLGMDLKNLEVEED